ncbi:glycosyltransferase [Leptolyngbya sp. O-77]|uniref:glycosyltransferase n=1 Tax=Leptolyngbya sp. O-77 TaxID=1080068 RepID=UPI00074D4AB1|nr:glycosyltransferase family 2 protein [Leptolyngbya sp. O-77]BAU41480.1 4,4'-diaponeurosporenoate glycosyltransferase [Leptolyngbya sp. O-77]
MSLAWLFIPISLVALSIAGGYFPQLRRAVAELPRPRTVQTDAEWITAPPRISVVIPMYNESENLAGCIRSVLDCTSLSADYLRVWVIDDQSTDSTLTQLYDLQAQLADPRLHILAGQPQPPDQRWSGKNWACFQAAQHADGDWLLFLDADVRLKPGAIASMVQTAIALHADLLTCIPQIVNGSLVEWLVQPLMFVNAMVTFNSEVVRDPKSPTTYALGPCLLFSRESYGAAGGHGSIGAEVAEDVAFARRLKHQGFRVVHVIGRDLLSLRMYRSFGTLWEGWTKVLYVGANYSVPLMLLLALVMLSIYTVPWLALAIALGSLLTAGSIAGWILLLLAIAGLGLQYAIRAIGAHALGTTTRYWWLHVLSGPLITALAIASIVKAETGWGWTWRGRSLKPLRR